MTSSAARLTPPFVATHLRRPSILWVGSKVGFRSNYLILVPLPEKHADCLNLACGWDGMATLTAIMPR
jgi:hypothetical protein